MEANRASETSGSATEPVDAPVLSGLEAARIYAAFLRRPLHCMRDVAARYGDLCLVANPVGARYRRFALALGPRYNRRVLGDPETFRPTGPALSGPRGSALRSVRNGLTRARGEKHQRIRALFMPALQRRGVARVEDRIASIAREMLDTWSPGDRRDLAAEMRALSMRVSSEILFAIEDRERAAAVGAMLGDFIDRSFSLRVLATRSLPVPGTPYRTLRRHAEHIEAEIAELIRERRQAGLGEDVISSMLGAVDRGVGWIGEEDLVGQITVLFGASYETTAQALTWTLFLLAQHPAFALELVDELNEAEAAGPVSGEVLDGLPRLDAILREALRLFPSIPYTLRICTRPAGLDSLELRRGDRIVCSHFHTQRMPGIFDAPDRFDPTRWSHIRPDPYEYLPFGVAPRLCPGSQFSTAVLKRVVAEVMRRFRFRVVPDTRIDLSVRVTVGPRDALPIEIAPADRGFRAAPVCGDVCELLDLADDASA